MASIEYRREVDGLRAIAVISIIMFHAGYQSFTGGFVGVDIFFVISGYLITSILIADIENGRFSIAGFYERRILRIFPALVFVILLSSIAAWILLLPSAFKSFSQSVMAVSAYCSNIFFWNTSGYFDTNTALKPLIHTWSLAVEEQYYLIFPVFLLLLWRFGKRKVFFVFALTAMASLLAAHLWITSNPTGAFYSFHTRAWELLLGAMSAMLVTQRNGRLHSQLMSLLGVFMIGWSVFFFDHSTPMPGLYALIPTVGTALVILFCSSDTPLGKLLGARGLVGIGLISYSAYLIHQPLFAFVRYATPSSLSEVTKAILILLTLLFAALSFRYVEQPFRKRGRFTRRQVFVSALVGGLLCFGVGWLGHVSDGFSNRMPPNVEWESLGEKLTRAGDVCTPEPLPDFEGANACYFGDVSSSKTVVLYGDSHAQAIHPALNEQFIRSGIRGVKVSALGCDIIPDVFDTRSASELEIGNCKRSFANLLQYLKNKDAPLIVVIRWTMRLYPIKGEIDQLSFDNHEGGVEWNEYREYVALRTDRSAGYGGEEKALAVQHLLEKLRSVSKKVIVVKPIPETGWDIARINMVWQAGHSSPLAQISTPHALYRQRNQFILDVFEKHRDLDGVLYVSPEDVFCDSFISDRCVAQHNGIPFYFDDDHLSDYGAGLVVGEILKKLNPILASSATAP